MRTFAAVIGILLIGAVVLGLYSGSTPVPGAVSIPANDVTANAKSDDGFSVAFVQGGTVAMELEGGDYRIVPSSDDQITISYRSNPMNVGKTRVAVGVKGSSANVKIQTATGRGEHFDIAVPAKTNLYTRMSAGNLIVQGVEGSKDLESRAGNVIVDVVDARQYGPVYASISSGNLSADAWSTHKPGLMRSFKTTGPGRYGLHAHVGAGNLTLTERSGLK